jgi:hypothetical protein
MRAQRVHPCLGVFCFFIFQLIRVTTYGFSKFYTVSICQISCNWIWNSMRVYIIQPKCRSPPAPFDFEPISKTNGGKTMNNNDFTKLSKKALLKAFEQEREELLAAGMSEADIFKIHYGEIDENGNINRPKDGSYGGDYLAWLDERKHTRSDHKYAPGTPVALDAVDPDGAWISSGRGGIDDVDFSIDLEAALSALTELQRFCFVEVVMNERTQESVAAEIGKTRANVMYAIGAAKNNLKKYFS